jgi:hypothetical protein
VAVVRKLVFIVLLIILGAFFVYGIAAGGFDETLSNGWML